MSANANKRRGFSLDEFVTSCSTCMGKEGLLNSVETKADKSGSVKSATK